MNESNTNTISRKLFLIDAYALIYRSYYAFIKNPRINSRGENTSAILGFVNTLEDVLRRENPTHIAVGFDPQGPTFRHEAYDRYKAQREETPEAIRFAVPIIKEIIKAYRMPIIEVAGYEADDVIGSLAVKAEEAGFDTYMMTPDKDYGQLVTEHIFMYRPRYGGDYDVLGVPEVCAKYDIATPKQVIDILGLMGDSSDNIPGCPGVGEKTAVKLIQEFGTIDNLLSNTDKLKGALQRKVQENRELIEFSRFLATIKTDVEVTFDEEALRRKPIDEEALRHIFNEMEFRTLADRILGAKASVATAQNTPQQASLFDVFDAAEQTPQEEEKLKSATDILHTYHLTDTEDAMWDLAALLGNSTQIAFDTETTGIDALQSELVGMSFAMQAHEAYYVPIPADRAAAEGVVEIFRSVLENESIMKIGQNIKYDYMVMRNYGVTLQGKMFDTMIAHYLLQPEQRHNMDYLAEVYMQYRTIPIENLIGAKGKGQLSMRQAPIKEVCEYAAEDADVTWQLYEILQEELRKEQMIQLFEEVEMPLVRVLAEMEIAGVRVDVEALRASAQSLEERIATLESEIHQLAGVTFNIASPRQVGEILFEHLKIDAKARKTKSGQYSTTEEVLERLRPNHPIVGKILDMRGLRKLLSTYINALPELINKNTGKIHTSFNQTVTATGRLSSSNPNLQNIPIRDAEGREIRRAFVASQGCRFFSADYSQIELRIMAHMSGDSAMIEAFNSGADIHTATAAKIFKVPINEVTSDMRRKAKTANFGIIYGISTFGLAERLSVSRAEAKTLIDGYFATYPRIKEYMTQCIEDARKSGHVTTVCGRRRMLPDINSHNATVRGYAERNAINAPIQGSAADIIKIAMIKIYNRMQREGLQARMILQVHDELNFDVPECEVEQLTRLVTEEMQQAYQLCVPLIADSGVADNWLEAH
ncbi:MAG: DNA polymerase I [Bacteroidaceae bacterium]|nr:DNA polymerase I [Bacteroidaceae bacterium]